MDFMEILKIVGSVLFMVLAISLCIFIHELGHFLAARWRGLHIVAFSIGFKKAWSKKFKDFEFRIGWLPFGGYVDLPQIDLTTHDIKDENGNPLPPAKPLDKIITAFAGPFFNVLLGFAVGCLVWWVGMPDDKPQADNIEVAYIDKKGPEYIAGLRAGDKIVKLNGKPFYCTWQKFIKEIIFTVGKVTLTVQRDGKEFDVSYVPKANPLAPEQMRREGIAFPYFEPMFPVTLYPEPDSPAEKAGIKDGDVVLEVNGKKIAGLDHFVKLENLNSKPMNMLVKRNGKEVLIKNIQPKIFRRTWRVGFEYLTNSNTVKVRRVVPGSAGAKAGLKAGDIIESIAGTKITSPDLVPKLIGNSEGKPFSMTLLRNDKPVKITVTAAPVTNYMIGARYSYWSYPTPWEQFLDVIDMTWRSVRGITYGLGSKLKMTNNSSTLKPRNLSGPLNLGQTLFLSVYRRNIMVGIYFMVVISFALAIFNLLPLPVLDGGYIVLGIVEEIIRKPLSPVIIKPLFGTFIFLLIGLMIYVTFFDFMRLMPAPAVSEEKAYKPDFEFSKALLDQLTPEERNALLAPKKPTDKDK